MSEHSGGSPTRQPHAVLDLPSRQWKAQKIERLLGLENSSRALRLLEIGTGSGGIAHYFGTHPSGRYTVEAVDVVDSRGVVDGYNFNRVSGTELPFESSSFDVVLSNHVIEHVGDEAAQHRHLAEIGRVMKPDGIGYLAVPNRWMLIEPHYRLIFLSWLPRSVRSNYLKLAGRGDFYDCEPFEMARLERFLTEAGFKHSNLCIEALRATFEIERPASRFTEALRRIPDGLLRPSRAAIPTLIYRLEHRQ